MNWNLEEAVSYYASQGAPRDQTALVGLLREIQQEMGGGIPRYTLPVICDRYGIKETFLLALIRRMPRLRLEDSHCLELCSGPNCGKHTALAACAEMLAKERSFTLKFVPCMRLCGKGPNLKWDGRLYHGATEELLRELTGENNEPR